ncbi:amino acid transporter [Elysia marginata]|uniref:Amino acid transporter n=1 Tax=Elysia marginata TaxID=1093978 RepID=A0AAV4GJM5_9GAST|nr:amino acid transporter [Elysia marginata]
MCQSTSRLSQRRRWVQVKACCHTMMFLGILSSLAVPSVNSSSVVAIVIILESMGVPTTGAIGLIMAMEWLNDRLRTTSNCLSHMACTLTTWSLCKDSLAPVVEKPHEMEEKVSHL